MSQVDEVLSRAEIEKKKVMKYLSNGSSSQKSSICGNEEDTKKNKSGDEPKPACDDIVTAMEDEDSVPYKELLSESKKKGRFPILSSMKVL